MSKREDVLNVLFARLSNIQDVTVKRNETLPQKIPKGGIVILRDGNMGESEVLLSPAHFIYQHIAEIEVIVQDVAACDRDSKLDRLLEQVDDVLKTDTNLGGLVDYYYPQTPEFMEELIEGAPTIQSRYCSGYAGICL